MRTAGHVEYRFKPAFARADGEDFAIGRIDRIDFSQQVAHVASTAVPPASIDFLRRFVDAGTSPICGNSICQDRRFLWRYMPKLEAYFHYRNLDVSSVKELAVRWYPNLIKTMPSKRSTPLCSRSSR